MNPFHEPELERLPGIQLPGIYEGPDPESHYQIKDPVVEQSTLIYASREGKEMRFPIRYEPMGRASFRRASRLSSVLIASLPRDTRLESRRGRRCRLLKFGTVGSMDYGFGFGLINLT